MQDLLGNFVDDVDRNQVSLLDVYDNDLLDAAAKQAHICRCYSPS